MALDKVVDSAVLDAGMTSVANAIRAKAGTTALLAWPDGFVTALGGITSVGGADLANVSVYVADFYDDEVSVTAGALDVYKRIIVS